MIKNKLIPCLILLSLTLITFISIPSCNKDIENPANDNPATIVKPKANTLSTISPITTSSYPIVTETEYAQATPLQQSLINRVQSSVDKLILYQEKPTADTNYTGYTSFSSTGGGFPFYFVGPPSTEPENDPAILRCVACRPVSAMFCLGAILDYMVHNGVTTINVNVSRSQSSGCLVIKWGTTAVLNPPVDTSGLPGWGDLNIGIPINP